MRGPNVLGLDNAPRYAYLVAAVLVLTVAYAVVQIVIVRPMLPYASQVPAGQLVQLVVFTAAASVLFLLRSSDATAALSVLALALSGIANSGPPAGSSWPGLAGEALTGRSWISTPIAFPVIALAILYFPSKSPLLDRHPALHAVPWLLALPMLVLHPEMAAFMVDGVQPGYMAPVSTLHREAEALTSDGGLMTMLRWVGPAARDLPERSEVSGAAPAATGTGVAGADRSGVARTSCRRRSRPGRRHRPR